MEAAEAHQYTALSCFTVLIYNKVQFDKLYLWTLKNSTPEDQTER